MLVRTPVARAAARASRVARRPSAQRRRDAGDMKPFHPGENLVPGDHARLDAGDGRALAIVKYAAARGVAPNSRKYRPTRSSSVQDDVIRVDAGFAGPVLAMSRPSGLSVSRDTQAVLRPSRARPTAVFNSAPPTWTSRLAPAPAGETEAGRDGSSPHRM